MRLGTLAVCAIETEISRLVLSILNRMPLKHLLLLEPELEMSMSGRERTRLAVDVVKWDVWGESEGVLG